jgi:hypothetical protein
MPPPSYPAQISAVIDRSSPSLSARAALDAYAANPHLRSSPTFEFLHFAVVAKYEVPNEQTYEEEVARSAGLEIRDPIGYKGSTFEGNLKPFYRLFDVSLLGLEPRDEPEWLEEVLDEPWNVIDVDLEDANGAQLMRFLCMRSSVQPLSMLMLYSTVNPIALAKALWP